MSLPETEEPTWEMMNEQFRRQEKLTVLLDWFHEYLKEKGLEMDYWNWKVKKGYVQPEGGLK